MSRQTLARPYVALTLMTLILLVATGCGVSRHRRHFNQDAPSPSASASTTATGSETPTTTRWRSHPLPLVQRLARSPSSRLGGRQFLRHRQRGERTEALELRTGAGGNKPITNNGIVYFLVPTLAMSSRSTAARWSGAMARSAAGSTDAPRWKTASSSWVLTDKNRCLWHRRLHRRAKVDLCDGWTRDQRRRLVQWRGLRRLGGLLSIFTRSMSPMVASAAWKFKKEEAPVEFGTPAIVNGIVYSGDDTGHFYALNASTATSMVVLGRQWNRQPGRGGERRRVHKGSQDHNLYALNASNGQKRWSYQTDSTVGVPVLYSNLVAVASNNGTVYALDAGNGSFKWKFPTSGGGGTSPWIAVTQNIVYTGSGDGSVYAINGGNGKQAWKYSTGGACGSPAVAAVTQLFPRRSSSLPGCQADADRRHRSGRSRSIASPARSGLAPAESMRRS